MKTYKVIRSLQFRYILGLSTIALLVSASYIAMQNVVSQQRNFSQLVNLAGHQSGLISRISFFASLMATTDDVSEFKIAKSQVGRSINTLKESHHILRNGSAQKGIPFVTNKNLDIIYNDHEFGLNLALTRFLLHAQGVYKTDMDELSVNSIDYVYLATYGPHILEPMLDSAVDEYDNIGNASTLKIERLELIIWLVTLLVLILEAVLIFHPLVKNVRKSIDSLEKSVAAHEASEKSLLEAQRLASLGDWQLNLANNTLTWTDEIYRIFGVSRKTFIPTFESALELVHPDDRQMVREKLTETELINEADGFEHRIIRPDGVERFVYHQSIAHASNDGSIISLTGTIQDITKQKLVQHELELYRNDLENLVEERTTALQTACKEAEQANKAKSQFLSNMSHELRTPLNAILGFSEMLEEYGEDISAEDKQTYISRIMKAGHHLLDLISDILDLSRIDAGHLNIKISPVPLSSAIKDVINQLDASLARKHHISLVTQVDDPNLIVLADPLRFNQVLINILTNAVKYNNEGGSVTVTTKPISKDRIRILITDTGKGITAADMDKLFLPFERLSHKNSSIEGTGIGLTITKQLVNAMNGSINVESIEGQGSTFWVDLPLAKQIKLPVQPKIEITPEKTQLSGDKHKVLYIEDNPVNTHLVVDALARKGGYEVYTCTTAEQGLTLAKEKIPDIILMDLTLPGINGIAALNILRTVEATSKIPVIAVTANAMSSDIEAGLAAGFEEYITKPINIKKLYRVINKHIPEVCVT